MEFKGIKGDWYCYRKTDQHKIEYIVTKNDEIICWFPHFNNDYSDANAKLISCAPDMLEMLEKIVRIYDDDFGNIPINEIEQLIKKATEI